QETELDLYVALHYSSANTTYHPIRMFASLLYTISAISFAQVVRAVFSLSVLVGLAMFFRPLLSGLMRATLIALRPRLNADQLAARRQLHDARL
ncbi:MAG TPA: hypothetical protein VF861_14945, partial [Telluria sp.]